MKDFFYVKEFHYIVKLWFLTCLRLHYAKSVWPAW